MLRLGTLLSSSLLAVILTLFATTASVAQSGEPIKVEVGKTTLLRIDRRPEVIFIANPAIVDIVIERAGATFLVGRQTGETNMHLLNGNGETIMNAVIVVVPQEARHITLHRGGAPETTYSCNPRCAGVPNPHAAGANLASGRQPGRQGSGCRRRCADAAGYGSDGRGRRGGGGSRRDRSAAIRATIGTPQAAVRSLEPIADPVA